MMSAQWEILALATLKKTIVTMKPELAIAERIPVQEHYLQVNSAAMQQKPMPHNVVLARQNHTISVSKQMKVFA